MAFADTRPLFGPDRFVWPTKGQEKAGFGLWLAKCGLQFGNLDIRGCLLDLVTKFANWKFRMLEL